MSLSISNAYNNILLQCQNTRGLKKSLEFLGLGPRLHQSNRYKYRFLPKQKKNSINV